MEQASGDRSRRRSSNGFGGCHRAAFTLIELLVVIGVIAILAALLLSVLTRAKEHGRMAKCRSNLHQIGIVLQLYIQDNDDRYPTFSGKNWISFRLGGGDPDPKVAAWSGLEKATNRILWPYTHSRELYRCPSDKGMNIMPGMQPFNSNYETIGSSYKYNERPWPWFSDTLVPEKDPYYGIAGKKENWISQPSRYILLHEPPATPYWDGGWHYFFWHDARGKSTVFSLTQVTDRFISPVLFADGHAAKHDFTKPIKSRPNYPFEPTPEWYFYEPAHGTP
ncbi:MAG: type II secretion system protein [Chloroflexi bacterium]|nr:type II secretion system protein [Chloroflexota bacterium]